MVSDTGNAGISKSELLANLNASQINKSIIVQDRAGEFSYKQSFTFGDRCAGYIVHSRNLDKNDSYTLSLGHGPMEWERAHLILDGLHKSFDGLFIGDTFKQYGDMYFGDEPGEAASRQNYAYLRNSYGYDEALKCRAVGLETQFGDIHLNLGHSSKPTLLITSEWDLSEQIVYANRVLYQDFKSMDLIAFGYERMIGSYKKIPTFGEVFKKVRASVSNRLAE